MTDAPKPCAACGSEVALTTLDTLRGTEGPVAIKVEGMPALVCANGLWAFVASHVGDRRPRQPARSWQPVACRLKYSEQLCLFFKPLGNAPPFPAFTGMRLRADAPAHGLLVRWLGHSSGDGS